MSAEYFSERESTSAAAAPAAAAPTAADNPGVVGMGQSERSCRLPARTLNLLNARAPRRPLVREMPRYHCFISARLLARERERILSGPAAFMIIKGAGACVIRAARREAARFNGSIILRCAFF